MKIKGVTGLELFAKGKRGLIYTGKYGKKKVAVKVKNPKSEALGKIKNEISFLQKLGKFRIGPKLLFSGKGFFVYEFVEGVFIKEYLEKETSHVRIKRVLRNVFEQCARLDKLGINKEEMHNPYKHIVVGEKIVLLDFERAAFTEKPHNVTQFVQYVIRNRKLLGSKGIKVDKDKLIELGREYKNNLNKANFNRILNIL